MALATVSSREFAGVQVRPAATWEAEQVLATLTLAFAADPPCRWMYPDPADYLRHFRAFARAFGGAALAHGTALRCASGAALWLAPGDGPDAAALAHVVETTLDARAQRAVGELFAAMGRVHPRAPHWYLPLVGVEPASQGRGLGEALMAPVLARCDAERVDAYLEATSPRSAAFYERLGFEPVATIEVGGCPRIVAMTRRPRMKSATGDGARITPSRWI